MMKEKEALIVIASFADGYLNGLLTSIKENTTDVNYAIQVIDNHRDTEKLKECVTPVCADHDVALWLDTKITGYGDALNTGVEMSTVNSKYILYMDSDTLVTKGWLREMIDCYKRHESEGCVLVGPMVKDFEDNYLPGVFELYGKPEELKMDFELPQHGYLIGVCILQKRDTIQYFKWDKNYLRAYWEDNDFTHQVRFWGKKVWVAGNSLMMHKVNSSHDTILKETGKSASHVGAANRQYFVGKWNTIRNYTEQTVVKGERPFLNISKLLKMTLGTMFTRTE